MRPHTAFGAALTPQFTDLQALEHHVDALHQQPVTDNLLATEWLPIAQAYFREGEYIPAATYATQYIDWWQDHGSHHRSRNRQSASRIDTPPTDTVTEAYDVLWRSYEAQDQYAEAVFVYEKLLTIQEERVGGTVRRLREIVALYVKALTDSTAPREAQRYYRRCLTHIKTIRARISSGEEAAERAQWEKAFAEERMQYQQQQVESGMRDERWMSIMSIVGEEHARTGQTTVAGTLPALPTPGSSMPGTDEFTYVFEAVLEKRPTFPLQEGLFYVPDSLPSSSTPDGDPTSAEHDAAGDAVTTGLSTRFPVLQRDHQLLYLEHLGATGQWARYVELVHDSVAGCCHDPQWLTGVLELQVRFVRDAEAARRDDAEDTERSVRDSPVGGTTATTTTLSLNSARSPQGETGPTSLLLDGDTHNLVPPLHISPLARVRYDNDLLVMTNCLVRLAFASRADPATLRILLDRYGRSVRSFRYTDDDVRADSGHDEDSEFDSVEAEADRQSQVGLQTWSLWRQEHTAWYLYLNTQLAFIELQRRQQKPDGIALEKAEWGRLVATLQCQSLSARLARLPTALSAVTDPIQHGNDIDEFGEPGGIERGDLLSGLQASRFFLVTRLLLELSDAATYDLTASTMGEAETTTSTARGAWRAPDTWVESALLCATSDRQPVLTQLGRWAYSALHLAVNLQFQM
ncbi:hypothetical protein IWQ60_001593 [Tieghemiomyces parasiticus]|uniref:Uncharacterized protein n=1 Tax=Tieghemiomyces parasiticus TaxID=78921 RepID=A0A9W8AGR5_9FUNG|nr:hypothetical protein IWQ60_001593 [Tieghemiomyces parasiticus]